VADPAAPPYGFDDDALARHPTGWHDTALAGRTVLVSGGAGGIGRAIGWLMGRLGARVVLTGRDQAKVDLAAAAMTARGLSASAHCVDIREPEAVAALFARLANQGGIDVLVNSAGGQFPQAAIDFSAKGWATVINTNLNGTWHMMQAAARHWRDAARAGSITNIVVVTRQGLHGVAHSVAARAGVVGLSQALAVEWAPLGIRINCIAPGTIETAGWRVYTPEVVARYPDASPMKRAGTAWDVAEAAMFLASDAGGYITGEVLNVAGGSQLWGETWTIPRPDWFGPSNAA